MKYKNEHKTLLILDLDETLIYATETPLNREADFNVWRYHVYKRPFLQEFICKVQQHFLLAVWSSASDDYVEEIAGHIFGAETELEFVWGRSRCTYRRILQYDEFRGYGRNMQADHQYLKTLQKLKRRGYTLKRTLIVDDSPYKLIRNYGNAIYVREYQGASDDRELKLLQEYLMQLKDEENVRHIEKRGWWTGFEG